MQNHRIEHEESGIDDDIDGASPKSQISWLATVI